MSIYIYFILPAYSTLYPSTLYLYITNLLLYWFYSFCSYTFFFGAKFVLLLYNIHIVSHAHKQKEKCNKSQVPILTASVH